MIACSLNATAQSNGINGPHGIAPATVNVGPTNLPGKYFRLMEEGCRLVEERIDAEPDVTLANIETDPEWRHFPYSIMASSVLYAKKNPANKQYRNPKMLALSLRIGDLLANENEKGQFADRLGANWDTYMWLEAYRLLEEELGEERKHRWKREIIKLLNPYEAYCVSLAKTARYNVPFLNTSPNHFSIYASELFLAGRIFGIKHWEKIGAEVMHRYVTEEISPDGFWGEHHHLLPTSGYNYLTVSSVALYWEHSKDPAALKALRKATNFHQYYTYPDGTPVEVINDRNRFWGVSPWGQFGFSNFPDGRRYAAFLASFFTPENIRMDVLGRLAQNALYYHEGRLESIPQDHAAYHHKMSIDAGIRKTQPWVAAYSALMSTQAVNNTFFLDRQGYLSIFHEKKGLVITGANSKRQPELATFMEQLSGAVYHLPINARLQMNDSIDRISLAYNTFFSDIEILKPSEQKIEFRVVVHGKGTPAEEAGLNFQLCLKPGEVLETAAGGKYVLDKTPVELSPKDIGGWLRNNGWTLQVDPNASLVWPVYPHNPYADKPENSLEKAVGVLTIPLLLREDPKYYVRVKEKTFFFSLSIE
ncbi:MAG: hypothetical protein KIT80_14205 [Chitinophagaceae bacterium]|nr:hypothetical protein [Chitinophagaceae bacterium]MCW5928065.1 hypothetical protein [Chitinophagaceae bacterium]